jgi:hypothetical protein
MHMHVEMSISELWIMVRAVGCLDGIPQDVFE